MNRNRMIIGLGVAIVVALLVSNFIYRQFQQASAVKPVVMGKIVVASKAVPLGTRLDASMVKTISWPPGDPVQGICTQIQDCTNRAVITPLTRRMNLSSKASSRPQRQGRVLRR